MSDIYTLRRETSADFQAISAVHKDAFGPSDPVPILVNSLRRMDAAFPTVSIVAEDQQGHVIGHIMASHSWLDAPKEMVDVLVLSPLGVRSQYEGQGIGTSLINSAIQAAKDQGAPLLFLEGNPAFYSKRGFEGAVPLGFRPPSLRIPERAFQVVKLPRYTPDMTGTLVYRDVFWEHDCVGLRKEG